MGCKSTLLAYLFFFSFAAQAQISGRVTDSAGHNMQFCNVLLLKAADSAIITGTTTDTAGNFNLKTEATGDVRLLAYFDGFKKQYTNIFTLSQPGQTYNA